jgi:outer membrane scaffolding protein for murein synthesis (MipA/OmpV family)
MIRQLPRLAIRVLLLTTVLSSSLHAAEPVLSAKPLWELGLGGGVLMQPQYPASDKYQTRSLGLPYVVYRGDILRIGDGGAARAVALDNGKVELSLSFAAAFDADSEGNPLRESMPDLDFIFEVGPQLVIDLRERDFGAGQRSTLQLALQTRAAWSTDFGALEHQGYVFEPMLRYRHEGAWHPQFEASIALKPLWATRDVHGYFYDVLPEFSNPARPEFRAHGGYFGTGVNISGSWRFNRQARMFVTLQTSYRRGAENVGSPLFANRFNAGLGLGFLWIFRESEATVMRP